MSIIQGIGDEVIEFFVAFISILIGVAAWWSTRITDRPLIRTVLVFERRSQSRQNQSVDRPEQTQRDYVQELTVNPPQAEPEENKPPTAGTSTEEGIQQDAGDSSERQPAEEQEQSAIVETMDSDTNVLRQRRLDFFENKEETDIRIKLKYINDDLKLVNGKLQEQLGEFKRRHFEVELQNNKLVRLIFNGQVLQRDDLTLQSCGLFDNCVVHCLVHQKRPNPNERTSTSANTDSTSTESNSSSERSRGNSQGQQAREWDLGNLFFAIVSFIIGAAWYLRYEYAQLYTVTATVALVGLTGTFTVLLVRMYFPDPDPPVQSIRT